MLSVTEKNILCNVNWILILNLFDNTLLSECRQWYGFYIHMVGYILIWILAMMISVCITIVRTTCLLPSWYKCLDSSKNRSCNTAAYLQGETFHNWTPSQNTLSMQYTFNQFYSLKMPLTSCLFNFKSNTPQDC